MIHCKLSVKIEFRKRNKILKISKNDIEIAHEIYDPINESIFGLNIILDSWETSVNLHVVQYHNLGLSDLSVPNTWDNR